MILFSAGIGILSISLFFNRTGDMEGGKHIPENIRSDLACLIVHYDEWLPRYGHNLDISRLYKYKSKWNWLNGDFGLLYVEADRVFFLSANGSMFTSTPAATGRLFKKGDIELYGYNEGNLWMKIGDGLYRNFKTTQVVTNTADCIETVITSENWLNDLWFCTNTAGSLVSTRTSCPLEKIEIHSKNGDTIKWKRHTETNAQDKQ